MWEVTHWPSAKVTEPVYCRLLLRLFLTRRVRRTPLDPTVCAVLVLMEAMEVYKLSHPCEAAAQSEILVRRSHQ